MLSLHPRWPKIVPISDPNPIKADPNPIRSHFIGSMWCLVGPSWRQGGFMRGQVGTRMAPFLPKLPPRWAKLGSRRSKVGPTWPQVGLNLLQVGPRLHKGRHFPDIHKTYKIHRTNNDFSHSTCSVCIQYGPRSLQDPIQIHKFAPNRRQVDFISLLIGSM